MMNLLEEKQDKDYYIGLLKPGYQHYFERLVAATTEHLR